MVDYPALIENYRKYMPKQMYEYQGFQGVQLNYEHQQRLLLEEWLTQIQIEGKWQKDLISIQTEEKKAQNRADVAEKAKYHKLEIYFTSNGKIAYKQELFGEFLQGVLPFNIRGCWLLNAMDKPNEPEILSINLIWENEKEKYIFLNMEDNGKNKIKQKFHKEGIYLGISEKKEQEILEALVYKLKNSANQIEIPTRFGWFMKNGKWGYVFPGELIWKEIKEWM